MKKVFLFLATAALFASCADDLLEPNNGFQAQDLSSKGITFQVVKDDPATRGMIERVGETNTYNSFFFAEKDQVNIWAADAELGTTRLYGWTNGDDGKLAAYGNEPKTTTTGNIATYKATKSQADPFLTAIDGTNLLNLVDYDAANKKATTGKFFAAYPTAQTVSYVAKIGSAPEYFKITASDLSQQQYDGYMNMDKRLMYAYATASKENSTTKEQNKSVGEKVALTFKSPLSTILFKCEDVETYRTILGNLKSITITSQYSPLLPNSTIEASYTVLDKDKVKVGDKFYLYGDVVPDKYTEVARADVNTPKVSVPSTFKAKDEVDVAPTSVSIAPDVFTYDVNHNMAWVSNSKSVYTRTATLTVGGTNGLEISNKDEMNLFVLPVGHDATNKKGENYTISYQFANVTLTYNWPTYASFNQSTGATRFTLNIANNFKYIVTDGTGASNRSLIVNDGKFLDIFGTGDNAGKVSWAGDYIDPSQFTSILINEKVTKLTEDDFKKLSKFTNVTSLKILNGTETLYPLKAKVAPATEYSGMTALTTLEAANVETVEANALPNSIQHLTLKNATTIKAQDETLGSLATLILPKYKFGTGVHPSVFFTTSGVNNKLKYLDLSSVETLCPAPGQTSSISFKNYEALDSVKLNLNGVKLYAEQFSGCTNLQKVTGLLDITDAKYAFSGCTNAILKSVKINGTVIPEGAFKGCNIVPTLPENSNVTSIGKDAFNGNTAIKKMDLSQAKTIGEGAFNGATNFVGIPDKDHYNAVVLIVDKVEANAFNGTKIASFFLQNATSTGNNSLASNAVAQIMYAADLKEEATTSPISASQVATDKKATVQIFVSNDGDKKLFSEYTYVTSFNFPK